MPKTAIRAHIDSLAPLLTNVSDAIWDFAETAFEEFQSAELLQKTLAENGFTIESGIAGIATAFCATYGQGKPVIGILAEYDALSSMSQKAGSSIREEAVNSGNGHGCGHNLFAGASLGAALAVARHLKKTGLPGTVKLYGCPGEEGGSGKAFMARAGVFNGLDAAFAWHPMSINAVFDTSMLANYQVLYKFKGVAAHAASSPHKGRSALDAVELMNVGVNFLREHVIQEARIHYAITNSGGFSPNVVQPAAEVLYLIRAPKTPQVEEIYRRVNKIAQGAALMTETELSIEFIKACANVVPNKTLSAVLYENFKAEKLPQYTAGELEYSQALSGDSQAVASEITQYIPAFPGEIRDCVSRLSGKSMCDLILPFHENAPDALLSGSSDVGDVSWNVPTAQIVTACYALGTTAHSWQWVSQGRTSVAHKGMILAAKVLAATIADVLEKPEVIAKAKQELENRLDGDTYRCAIPDDVTPKAVSKL